MKMVKTLNGAKTLTTTTSGSSDNDSQIGFNSDKSTFTSIHDMTDLIKGDGVKYISDLLIFMRAMLNRHDDHDDHDLVSIFIDPLKSINENDTYLRLFVLLKDYLHNSQSKNFVTPWMLLTPVIIHLIQDETARNHIKVVDVYDKNSNLKNKGVLWKNLINIPYARAPIYSRHIGSGWLVKAIYGLITGAMQPPYVDKAVVEKISFSIEGRTKIETDKLDGKFAIEISGRGCFKSEGEFIVRPDDITQHNLRDNITAIAEALGDVSPSIYRLGKKEEAFFPDKEVCELLDLPSFAIVQWVTHDSHRSNCTPRYMMRIVFGKKHMEDAHVARGNN